MWIDWTCEHCGRRGSYNWNIGTGTPGCSCPTAKRIQEEGRARYMERRKREIGDELDELNSRPKPPRPKRAR